jgi:nucleotide-binding universal stress UspA family protein
MYQRILVPVKRDATDSAAVEHAISLARMTGGKVILLHVVHTHSRDEAVFLTKRATIYLGELAQKFSEKGVAVTSEIKTGEPVEAIAEAARERNADLIVMGTHGHSEARHVFVGSVTESVVRQSDTPVLLVRPRRDG